MIPVGPMFLDHHLLAQTTGFVVDSILGGTLIINVPQENSTNGGPRILLRHTISCEWCPTDLWLLSHDLCQELSPTPYYTILPAAPQSTAED